MYPHNVKPRELVGEVILKKRNR